MVQNSSGIHLDAFSAKESHEGGLAHWQEDESGFQAVLGAPGPGPSDVHRRVRCVVS